MRCRDCCWDDSFTEGDDGGVEKQEETGLLAVDDEDDVEKVDVEEQDDQTGDFKKSLASFSFKTEEEQSKFFISMVTVVM